MKRIVKITIILMVIFINFANLNSSYASEDIFDAGTQGSGGEISGWSNKPESYWKPQKVDIGQKEFNTKAKTIVAAVRGIGIIVSVIALIVIGIKQATASVEEKSNIKQAMPGYILGIIMVASISFLPTIIYNFVKNIK